jgi:hypothetical protein
MPRRKKTDWSGPIWKIWPAVSVRSAVETWARRQEKSVPAMVEILVVEALKNRAGTGERASD